MAELFVNDPGTILASNALSTDLTISVSSSTGYPLTGNFRIIVDVELMLVTNVSGTTWTVTRAIEGTIAAAHVAGTNVNHMLTAGALNTAITATTIPFTFVQEAQYSTLGAAPTSFTVTFPQTTASGGNTAFMLISTDGSQTVTLPAGWTVDFNITQATYARLVLLHKTTASDTSATITTSSGNYVGLYFFELSGVHTLDVSSTGGMANNNVVVVPSITPTAGALVFCAAAFTITQLPLGASQSISPKWKPFVASGWANGSRLLTGHVATIPALGTTITPPAISVPGASLYASGGVAYASFSII